MERGQGSNIVTVSLYLFVYMIFAIDTRAYRYDCVESIRNS